MKLLDNILFFYVEEDQRCAVAESNHCCSYGYTFSYLANLKFVIKCGTHALADSAPVLCNKLPTSINKTLF